MAWDTIIKAVAFLETWLHLHMLLAVLLGPSVLPGVSEIFIVIVGFKRVWSCTKPFLLIVV